MARTQDQRRWRANTTRKRIEIYLPVERIAELEALANSHDVSRAKVIDTMIADAHAASELKSVATTAGQAPETLSEPATVSDQEADKVATSPKASAKGYRFRRPKRDDEKRYAWIAETDGGKRIGLGPDPVRFYRWCGTILDGSIYIKQTKSNSRDDVVARLLP